MEEKYLHIVIGILAAGLVASIIANIVQATSGGDDSDCTITVITAVIDKDSLEITEPAKYLILWDFVWSAERNGAKYPGASAHFSPPVATVSKTAAEAFYKVGDLASAGVKFMAETGQTTTLVAEITATGNVAVVGVPTSKGTELQQMNIECQPNTQFATVTTMIAPSPDWFVGISALSLVDDENNTWKNVVTAELWPMSAGTDKGVDFTSANDPREPPVPIEYIAGDAQQTLFNGNSLGTVTFLRVKT